MSDAASVKAAATVSPAHRLDRGEPVLRLAGSSAAIVLLVLGPVVIGGGLWLAGFGSLADVSWAAAIVIALIPLTVNVARELRRRQTGVDLIALMAMAGALVLGQFLAGAVIGLMLAGGEALERYANGRAARELTALLARAPQTVHRYESGALVSRGIGEVEVGDRLLVKPGEVVPVDGTIAAGNATLDESALTGESMPVEHEAGQAIRSGTLNLGGPFDLEAASTADASTYAGIIRLVRSAQESKAPFVRLADRYALWFLGLTLVVAAFAWFVSGDPIRALAVLVVATPCPLILAAPIAIVAGMSRAAHAGVIVKGGGALETLARVRTLVFDKTGTLTAGKPQVASVEVFDGLAADEVLRLAASLDQVSPHVFADGIVRAARNRKLKLEFPNQAHDYAGLGIDGVIGARHVALGQLRWLRDGRDVPPAADALRNRLSAAGKAAVFVSVDSLVRGALVIEDPIRTETPEALRAARHMGISRIVLLSGDRRDVAQGVGKSLGVDAVFYEQSPEQKIEVVGRERRSAVTVMVGDGVNDAPALAAADVGVAMGARGATASSEAADAVILVDRLDRVVDALSVSRRARSIAVQSVMAGMTLSVAGMALATLGFLPPVAGAIFQEAIDVAVILNALRALRA
jgi:heavy metal translocating P-type ATPase